MVNVNIVYTVKDLAYTILNEQYYNMSSL